MEKMTKLSVRVVTGTSASGMAITRQRTFNHINPEISDEDAYEVGQALGGLQTYAVDGVVRTDTTELGD